MQAGRVAPLPLLQLVDLQEVELDRRLAAEDADQHLDLVALRVDLVDGADELGEGAVLDADALPLGELSLNLGASTPICLRIFLTSPSMSGVGRLPDPTKLVTPGVLRTTYQDSSVITISTST